MVRWHQSDCFSPEVVVDPTSKRPKCRSCYASPNIEELATTIAGFSPLPTLPPDEPLNQLRLSWPESMHYYEGDSRAEAAEKASVDAGSGTLDSDSSTPCPAGGMSTSEVPDASASHRYVYERSLREDEFRLLRLPCRPSLDAEDIVHVDIEIYDDDDHPDYETTSYTWGGENGNSTLCKPVYVGEYWDILFQTENCWDMLRALKDHRGDRMLWVDAICINQRDTAGERERQIAKMFSIFRKAMRVILFLGPDMYGPLPAGRTYPRKRELDSILHDDSMTLAEILGRRYFARVWVVQELVLAREIVIRVGGVEYFIRDRTTQKIEQAAGSPKWRWEECSAPWLQYACKERVVQRFKTSSILLDLSALTKACHCADPRDRVFGIAALLDDIHGSIKPDYSLSLQNVMMGTFAHCLVNNKDLRILRAASGIDGWGEYPSWVPHWKTPARDSTLEGHWISATTKADDRDQDFTVRWQMKAVYQFQMWEMDRVGIGYQSTFNESVPNDYCLPTDSGAQVYIGNSGGTRLGIQVYNSKARQPSPECPTAACKFNYGMDEEIQTAAKWGPAVFNMERWEVDNARRWQIFGATGLRLFVPGNTGHISISLPRDYYLQLSQPPEFRKLCTERGTTQTPSSLIGVAASGNLCLRVIHLLRFDKRPSIVDQCESSTAYRISKNNSPKNNRAGNRGEDAAEPLDYTKDHIFFLSSNRHLESLIRPGKDHLCVVSEETDEPQAVHLIIRATDNPGKFKLVAICDNVYFTPCLGPSRLLGSITPSCELQDVRRPWITGFAACSSVRATSGGSRKSPDFRRDAWILRHVFVNCLSPAAYETVAKYAWTDDDGELWQAYVNALAIRRRGIRTPTLRELIPESGEGVTTSTVEIRLPKFLKLRWRLSSHHDWYEEFIDRSSELVELVDWEKDRVWKRVGMLWDASGTEEPEWGASWASVVKRMKLSLGPRFFKEYDPWRVVTSSAIPVVTAVFQGSKSDLLRNLRYSLRSLNDHRLNRNWNGEVWRQGDAGDKSSGRPFLGPVGEATWSYINRSEDQQIPQEDRFLFDGMTYQIEIV